MDDSQTLTLLPVSTGRRTFDDPPGTMVDGAVAELTLNDDGTITAEVRIPGPAVP